MTRNVRAGDWIAIASEQAVACRQAHGVQLFQSGVLVQTVPFTPGEFARQTFDFWATKLVDVLNASDLVPGVQEGIDGRKEFTAIAKATIEHTDSIAVKQTMKRIDIALRTILDSTARGAAPGTRNAQGLLCLDGVNSVRFWDSVASLGREYSFLGSDASIPVVEYWLAVKEGATDGLRNVGEAAGKALGEVGEGIGVGVSGLLSGLGVVNVALLAGGGYLIARKVF